MSTSSRRRPANASAIRCPSSCPIEPPVDGVLDPMPERLE
jgi:hypothetical protein